MRYGHDVKRSRPLIDFDLAASWHTNQSRNKNGLRVVSSSLHNSDGPLMLIAGGMIELISDL